MPTSLILASSSPYRRLLLERLYIPFSVTFENVDESALPNELPEAHVKRLSLKKAYTIANALPEAYCIGSDAVAVYQGTIVGKPLTHDNAVQQLRMLSGQSVTFHTGVCLVNVQHAFERYALVKSRVIFRPLTDQMIENYLHKIQPYHCAGSFQSETLGSAIMARFEGDDPTALIGLPLIALTAMLEDAGIPVV